MSPLDALRPLGPVLNPAMIEGTYAALTEHRLRLPGDARALWDLAYGDNPRQGLNLFLPAKGTPDRVMVYVHGGGFVAGDKGKAGSPFYANTGAFALAQGWAGAAMTYRLVPEARWPSGAEDIARAVDWLAAGAGGALNAPQILLVGQSAGAVHVADYLAGRGGAVSPQLKGAVLMSGRYDFTGPVRMGYESAYQGDNPAPQSTLSALVATDVPLMFTISDLDPPEFQQQAALLVDAMMAQHGRWPRLHWLAGHNHVSPALYLGAKDDRVGPLIADFATAAFAPASP